MVNLDNAAREVNLSIMAKQIVVGVKVNQSELEDWKAIASVSGMTVPRWLRGLANEAASNGPGIAQEPRRILSEPVSDLVIQEAAEAVLEAIDGQALLGHAVQGNRAAEGVERAAAPVVSKPTVNDAIGREPGEFRPSPKCENARCERLKMALCGPCRKAE